MKPILALAITLMTALPAAACGNSPLLNHVNARRPDSTFEEGRTANPDVNPDPQDPSSANCPLEFPNAGLCASLTWDSAPSDDQESAFTLRFWNKASASASGPYENPADTVAVQPWMPTHGHGVNPPPPPPTPLATGIFSVSKIYFSMPGQWDIRVQLKKGSQVVEQAIVRINF